jgi:hypothetical protein
VIKIREEMKIKIEEVNRVIEMKKVPYGQDVTFPLEIDTTPCEEFFGKRCPYNIHVTGSRTAHKDRFDPRTYWREHLDYDVGIPHEVVTIGTPTFIGGLIGGLLDHEKPISGAVAGAMLGLICGFIIEAITEKES